MAIVAIAAVISRVVTAQCGGGLGSDGVEFLISVSSIRNKRSHELFRQRFPSNFPTCDRSVAHESHPTTTLLIQRRKFDVRLVVYTNNVATVCVVVSVRWVWTWRIVQFCWKLSTESDWSMKRSSLDRVLETTGEGPVENQRSLGTMWSMNTPESRCST